MIADAMGDPGSLGVRGSIPLSSTKFSKGWLKKANPFSMFISVTVPVHFVCVFKTVFCKKIPIKFSSKYSRDPEACIFLYWVF
jgi:hypothetical protein